jgi:O-antigen ligase
MSLIFRPKINKVIRSDAVITLLLTVLLVTYNYNKNLSPDSFLFFIQITLLWFFLRILYGIFPVLKRTLLVGLLVWGLFEAVHGLGQLYNYIPSNHALFKTTGTFFNSGPYGGFIALQFPLALHFWFYYRKRKTYVSYIFIAIGVICFAVFPATLSRTAWIAAIVGCLAVLVINTRFIRRLCIFWKRRKKQVIFYSVILLLILSIGLYGIYKLKKDSADGRLFLWKITALAIRESPVKGVGFGGFPAAYADAQMKYFKNGKATATEKLVAGSPEYAFNEYLQLFLEQGLFGIILFLLLTFLIIKEGIKNKQTGAAGSFIALSVFAFASYPYQLWEFPIIWVLLGTICVTSVKETSGQSMHPPFLKSKNSRTRLPVLGIVCLLSVVCAMRQKPYYSAKKEWKKVQSLYTVKAYESITGDYTGLYPILNYEPKFVFEYAVALNGTGQYEMADRVLSRGLQLSCDPMFYNVKGRNYHEMKKYKEAEECYIRSTYLLPERIYPYYLLTKLYADSAYYHPEQMLLSAKAVLEKEPKVHSMAIKEMRMEVNKILKEKGYENE